MLRVRTSADVEEGQRLWERLWPAECIFDLWPVRAFFAASFSRPPFFIVAEDNHGPAGLLALSWIEEEDCFGCFPGETWHGQTWLEQNRILADSPDAARELLSAVPGPAELRYLRRHSLPLVQENATLDEIGYLLLPGQYDYSFDSYMQQFSGKSRKKLGRELAVLESAGVSYRYDCFSDIDYLFRMNQQSFGEESYFSDARFLEAFENLASWLKANGFLRVTTVIIGGETAAVDIGAVWGRTYTVMAGCTHPEFPGVAKLINFHHMEWACRERLETVDFLCGDFGWKQRFHLTPRSLYKIRLPGLVMSQRNCRNQEDSAGAR